MKNALAYLDIDDNNDVNYAEFKELAIETFKRYCERYGLDLVAISDRKINIPFNPEYKTVLFEKWQVKDLLEEYDRICMIDLDMLIHERCPNIFDVVPEDCVGAVLEDVGSRKNERHRRIQCMKEHFPHPNLEGWDDKYFNAGLVVLSKQHADLYDINETIELGMTDPNRSIMFDDIRFLLTEQTILNWRLNKLGFKFHELDNKFNYIKFIDRWKVRLDAANIIHYAGFKHRAQMMAEDFTHIESEWNQSGWSVSHQAIDFMVRYCKENKVRNVIEFGGGRSTKALSKISGIYIDTFEHNKDFYVSDFSNNVSSYLCSPIKYMSKAVFDKIEKNVYDGILREEKEIERQDPYDTKVKRTFYDIEPRTLSHKYDAALIDGPHGNGRIIAFHYLRDRLRPGSVLFIDDFNNHIKLVLDNYFEYEEIFCFNESPSPTYINNFKALKIKRGINANYDFHKVKASSGEITDIKNIYNDELWHDYCEEQVDAGWFYRFFLHNPSFRINDFAWKRGDPIKLLNRQQQIIRHISGKALDIGCNTGVFALHLKQKGIDIHGIDASKTFIKIAQAYARLFTYDPNMFSLGLAQRIPFPDKHFDTVHCQETLEHLPATEQAIDEIYRVLKKDGIFCGGVPYKEEPFHHEGHFLYFDEKIVRNMLGKKFKMKRMKVVRSRVDGFRKKGPEQLLWVAKKR